jgi:hypothetical protein
LRTRSGAAIDISQIGAAARRLAFPERDAVDSRHASLPVFAAFPSLNGKG